MGDPALGNLVDVPGEADGVAVGGSRSVGRSVALRDKTGSHGRLPIFQPYEVIFPIGNHPTEKICIFSNSA